MAFITAILIVFVVTGRLIAQAIAKPIPDRKAGGIAIPLTRHSSLNSNGSIDLEAITSHSISVREKILDGLDNYELNMGSKHPFAVKRNESGFEKRGRILPLTNHENGVWMGQISIGTPPQTVMVEIDTGSADMWARENNCVGISESGNCFQWDPIFSETVEYNGQSFKLIYDDGTIVRGDQYIDNVTIAGFTADDQTFGAATSYKSPLIETGHSNGLLGLAFPSISKFGADPLFVSLVRQGRVINPTFSLSLTSSGAELYVGGANSMLYRGDITYSRITVPGFWGLTIDDVRVNGVIVLRNIPAILDTGSNFIFGDLERVETLYSHFGGSIIKDQRGSDYYYYLPCDSFPTLGLTFSGKTFKILPDALIGGIAPGSSNCYSTVVGEHQPQALWIIGTPFLRSVYSVFDYSTQQVGFASLA